MEVVPKLLTLFLLALLFLPLHKPPTKGAAPMAKKKTTPVPDDIQMYSGHVRLYGGVNYTEPLDDMAVERFPATSDANARAFLIQAGRQYLDDAGYPNAGGIQILFCGPDNEAAKKVSALAIVERNNVPKQPTVRTAPATVYKAFKCPINTLCRTRFTGKYVHGTDSLIVDEE